MQTVTLVVLLFSSAKIAKQRYTAVTKHKHLLIHLVFQEICSHLRLFYSSLRDKPTVPWLNYFRHTWVYCHFWDHLCCLCSFSWKLGDTEYSALSGGVGGQNVKLKPRATTVKKQTTTGLGPHWCQEYNWLHCVLLALMYICAYGRMCGELRGYTENSDL